MSLSSRFPASIADQVASNRAFEACQASSICNPTLTPASNKTPRVLVGVRGGPEEREREDERRMRWDEADSLKDNQNSPGIEGKSSQLTAQVLGEIKTETLAAFKALG